MPSILQGRVAPLRASPKRGRRVGGGTTEVLGGIFIRVPPLTRFNHKLVVNIWFFSSYKERMKNALT